MIGLQKKVLLAGPAREKLAELEKGGEKVVLTYGHFNSIHPGHMRFLQHAYSLGDKLVLAIMGQHHLEEQQAKRFFSTSERAMGVASLASVDYSIVLDGIELEEVIQILKPAVFILGKEFEEERRESVQHLLDLVESQGGKNVFSSGEQHYASAEALFNTLEEIHGEKLIDFSHACDKTGVVVKELVGWLEKFKSQRLLVIGDSIVDQYVACDALGMSAEAPVLAIRELNSKEFIGGAAIVACHIRSLGAQCHYISVIGEDDAGRLLERELNRFDVAHTLIPDSSRPTTFKIRYMVENQKLLRVSKLVDHTIGRKIEKQLLDKVEELAPSLDGIVISDFVYGVVTDRVLEVIGEITKKHNLRIFGDLQCSSQVGNVAKFKQFNLITPTEREARIALSDQESGLEKLSRKMLNETGSKNLLITLGGQGFIAYQNDIDSDRRGSQHFPALNHNPIDVAGAGDTLLSVMAIANCAGANLMESAALGSCGAAIAVGRVGNIPLKPKEIENYLQNLIPQISV